MVTDCLLEMPLAASDVHGPAVSRRGGGCVPPQARLSAFSQASRDWRGVPRGASVTVTPPFGGCAVTRSLHRRPPRNRRGRTLVYHYAVNITAAGSRLIVRIYPDLPRSSRRAVGDSRERGSQPPQ